MASHLEAGGLEKEMTNGVSILISNGVASSAAPQILEQILQPLIEKLEGVGEDGGINAHLRLRHYNRPYHSFTKVRVWNEGFRDALNSVSEILRKMQGQE